MNYLKEKNQSNERTLGLDWNALKKKDTSSNEQQQQSFVNREIELDFTKRFDLL